MLKIRLLDEFLNYILVYQITSQTISLSRTVISYSQTKGTCAIAITADVSFKAALAAELKREYKKIEFLWKQRPGVGGMIVLPLLHLRYQGNIIVYW